jgi:deoxyribodipyrimidine photo-lyase
VAAGNFFVPSPLNHFPKITVQYPTTSTQPPTIIMSVAIFWFRRDLRLRDNAGLYRALRSGLPVQPIFIFDRHILDELTDRTDARVSFIHQVLTDMQQQLRPLGASLAVYYGQPETVWPQVLQNFEVSAVYTNGDQEPYALERDATIGKMLAERNIALHTFKDHIVFDHKEVLKDDGLPYTVFSPYMRKWRAKLATRISTVTDENGQQRQVSYYLKPYAMERYFDRFNPSADRAIPTLSDMNFEPTTLSFPPISVARSVVKNYENTRNFPALPGTTRLGIHFRFGTISVREKALAAMDLSDTYVNELIWRDFYSQILAHFPHVVTQPFRAVYNNIPWRTAPDEFERWCEGKTGFPIVDAGMRELNATGYMHNRVRMITASFLTKHLLIDWRLGEAYFAQKLLDFDLASNSGGWQWAAGCGTDAAPYFRVFNPTEQAKKFDTDNTYIRRWVPEFGTPKYPKPIVDHAFARNRCLETYKKALG